MKTDRSAGRTIIMLAGFGDTASLFDGLRATPLARENDLLAFNMPGFGAPPLGGDTTIEALADSVADLADRTGAEILLAHSSASVVASVALCKSNTLDTVLSIEGNITADDAYFSGTAADYEDPAEFKSAFLARLDRLARENEVVRRYHLAAAEADPLALWQFGRDVRRFSEARHPGEFLVSVGKSAYLYDPPNCPQSTLDWLRSHPIEKRLLPGASHWPSVDAPDLLSAKAAEALEALKGVRPVPGGPLPRGGTTAPSGWHRQE